MDSDTEIGSEIPFRMDNNNEFFFDSTEPDNFNVNAFGNANIANPTMNNNHNNNSHLKNPLDDFDNLDGLESMDMDNISNNLNEKNLIAKGNNATSSNNKNSNTGPNNLTLNISDIDSLHVNQDMNFNTLGMDMGINMNNMNTLNMNNLDLTNTNTNTNNNISRPTSENSDIGEGTNMFNDGNEKEDENGYIDINSNTVIHPPLEKSLTANSTSSLKQKSSPKRVLDKRRSSLPADENGNQQKRTRASGEMLEYLMNEFAKNSNPTTAMRKEISNKIGMPERSVRIWFQNRRAKARKMEKLSQTNDPESHDNSNSSSMSKTTSTTTTAASTTVPAPVANRSATSKSNLSNTGNKIPKSTQSPNDGMRNALNQLNNNLLKEINGKYYIIECKSLSVGNWQRIRSGYVKENHLNKLTNLSPRLLSEIMSTTDLLVILSKKDKELNYFFSGVFQNEKVLFRIFYPLVSILKCSILNQTQQMNNNENFSNPDFNDTLLQLELSSTPQFAVHFLRDPATGKENVNQWSICEDFSEGQQVATAFIGDGGTGLPHILADELNRLKYFNSLITSFNKPSVPNNPPTSTSSFPGPTPESQIINSTQFSPLNHNNSTNNSTPSSITMIPNYAAFPQNTFTGLNLHDDATVDNGILNPDLLYSLDQPQRIQQTQLNQQHTQLQMQQLQRQFHIQQQQQQQRISQPQSQSLQHTSHNLQQHSNTHKNNNNQYLLSLQQKPGQNLQQLQQSLTQSTPNDRSLYHSQMPQRNLQQQSQGVLTPSNIALEGLFNSTTALDSDIGDNKLESSDLDIFRQDNHHDNGNDEDVLIRGDEENLTNNENEAILLTTRGVNNNNLRDGLMDSVGKNVENDFIKQQEGDNFFLDDGINGLGF